MTTQIPNIKIEKREEEIEAEIEEEEETCTNVPEIKCKAPEIPPVIVENQNLKNELYDKRVCTNTYTARIIKRLNDLGLDGETFCRKIYRYECLMAGSFPLQCLLEETYEGSDVDIFVARSRLEEQLKSKDESKVQQAVTKYTDIERWLLDEYKAKSRPSVYIIRDVICTRKYAIGKATVNVILVDTKCLETHIKETFDMSFCQTTFDGITLKYHDITPKKIGYYVNLHGLKKKEHYHITEKQYKDKETIYIKKYGKDAKDMLLNEYHRVYPDTEVQLSLRTKKYESRGFTILDNPPLTTKDIDSAITLKYKTDYAILAKQYAAKLTQLNEVEKENVTLKEALKMKNETLRTLKEAFSLLMKFSDE